MPPGHARNEERPREPARQAAGHDAGRVGGEAQHHEQAADQSQPDLAPALREGPLRSLPCGPPPIRSRPARRSPPAGAQTGPIQGTGMRKSTSHVPGEWGQPTKIHSHT